MTLRVAIEGVSFWASRLPGWEIARAVISGEQAPPDAASARPSPTLLAPTERRRAPDTVAVALEVAARACEAAGRKPSDLPSVFASTHGDLAISDYMCSTLATTPALISPIKFHNSVHNAAAGYWSIGTGSLAPYTAISSFESTFGEGLLEAATQVVCEQRPVLYVAFDIEAKGALATMAPSRGLLGAALVLAPVSQSQQHRSLILTTESVAECHPTPARSAAAALVADNALAPCLPFFEVLASTHPRTLCLALGQKMALNVQVN
ncbi:beta-ketoacyl synthase chain length factor [Steroidobacter cummioxidans]|uniref:beta-ketoacyl synthase chain length factor n=1 Tax=Steroidobacter cummioxidans TaxID=1803913 RepID=UPI000E314A8E|nr:beta-ketoacyl synthase chain length factor [Steroidobacter cummioxidans]